MELTPSPCSPWLDKAATRLSLTPVRHGREPDTVAAKSYHSPCFLYPASSGQNHRCWTWPWNVTPHARHAGKCRLQRKCCCRRGFLCTGSDQLPSFISSCARWQIQNSTAPWKRNTLSTLLYVSPSRRCTLPDSNFLWCDLRLAPWRLVIHALHLGSLSTHQQQRMGSLIPGRCWMSMTSQTPEASRLISLSGPGEVVNGSTRRWERNTMRNTCITNHSHQPSFATVRPRGRNRPRARKT